MKNHSVAVREWNDRIIFLRKIIPGAADKSYGIQVARLAGLPQEILDRAKAILTSLEANASAPEASAQPVPAANGQPPSPISSAPRQLKSKRSAASINGPETLQPQMELF